MRDVRIKTLENEYELEHEFVYDTPPADIFNDTTQDSHKDPVIRKYTTLRIICFLTLLFFILSCLFLCGIYFFLQKSIETNKIKMKDLEKSSENLLDDIKTAQNNVTDTFMKIWKKIKVIDDLENINIAQNNLSHKIEEIFPKVKEWLWYFHPECIDNYTFSQCKQIALMNYCPNFIFKKLCCRTCIEHTQSQEL